jgi:S1-C subfamily serine protease
MSQSTALNPMLALSRHIQEIVGAVAHAVVGIRSQGRHVGSGFVWRPGVVVTGSEVVEAHDDLSVTLADKTLAARLAGSDGATGTAVLQVAEGLPQPLRLVAGNDPQVGQTVLALGRGSEGMVASLGMVSTAGGPWQSRRGGRIDRLVRLDMRLGAGAEGGVVLDDEGAPIGMGLLGPHRRPLLIPVLTIERVAPRLVAEGRIPRGYLGAGLHPIRLDDALAAVHGLADKRASMVVSVDPEGPARKAGVLVGDVIVGLGGEAVPGVRCLLAKLTPESVGTVAELKLLRAGQIATAKVAIAARPGA